MKKLLIALMLVCMIFSIAGCAKEEPSPATSGKSAGISGEVNKQEAEDIKVKLYFPNNDASEMVAVEKTVKVTGTTKYKAAIEALLAGTTDKKLTNVIPKKTKLLGAEVVKDTIKLNFSKELIDDFNGGSTGEEMLVGSIVNTMTEFPEIKKVHILVEGKTVDTIKGHMDTSVPLTRMKELLK
ncbi:MAG: GerMN domain-containing protein [Anaerovibrio sp.]|uniref:GerMN domain-containing protein n=1 Tax=Anaerovibrio sp. TaxID=1872532 RepID=UPI0025D48F5B|nr:GerMN domain-containing protein [Anaerovibrio sp.]MCR5175546.1 GerMN domain-containing protein [Anaerovibrio sp.]